MTAQSLSLSAVGWKKYCNHSGWLASFERLSMLSCRESIRILTARTYRKAAQIKI